MIIKFRNTVLELIIFVLLGFGYSRSSATNIRSKFTTFIETFLENQGPDCTVYFALFSSSKYSIKLVHVNEDDNFSEDIRAVISDQTLGNPHLTYLERGLSTKQNNTGKSKWERKLISDSVTQNRRGGFCSIYIVQLPENEQVFTRWETFMKTLIQIPASDRYLFINSISSSWSNNAHIVEKGVSEKILLVLLELNNKVIISRGEVSLQNFSHNNDLNPISMKDKLEFEYQYEVTTNCKYCRSHQVFELFRIMGSSIDGHTFPSNDKFFPHFLQNFNKRSLRISTPRITGRIEFAKDVANNLVFTRGMYKYLMEAFASKVNATLGVVPAKGGGTGLAYPNGTWNGVIGDIIYDDADIGLVTAVTSRRFRVVQFSTTVEFVALVFSTGKPLRVFTWKTILWPFQSSVWLVILLGGGSLTILLAVLPTQSKIQSINNGNNNEGRSRSRYSSSWGVTKSVSFMIGSSLDQSGKIPEIYSLRFICLCWLLFSLNAGALYKSKYFSYLTFPVKETIPGSFQELASSSNYRKGLQFFGGAASYYFRTSRNPTYMKINRSMELVSGTTECFSRAIAIPHYCCISWHASYVFVLNRNFGDKHGRSPLVESKATSFESPLALAMRKGVLFLEKINTFLGAALKGDLIGRWIDQDMTFVRLQRIKLQKMKQKSSNQTESVSGAGAGELQTNGPNPLSLHHLKGASLLLFVGCVVSITIYLAELILIQLYSNSRR